MSGTQPTTTSPSDWPEIAKTFATMTREQLIHHKYLLIDEKLTIKHQLDLANVEEAMGEKIDPIWRAKATRALEARQRYIDEIHDHLQTIEIHHHTPDYVV